MGVDHKAVLEAQEEVLADRVDGLDAAAGDSSRSAGAA
jgi:hypothetical protein